MRSGVATLPAGAHYRTMDPASPFRAAMPAGHATGPVLATTVQHFRRDTRRVAIPHPEVQLVARFAPSIDGGVDIHALGPRTRVHRKFIHGGQRALLVRLRPGTCDAALGSPASDLGDDPVPLEALWGGADAGRLRERLARTDDAGNASRLLHATLSQRTGRTRPAAVPLPLLDVALGKLEAANVGTVARDLGLSERHLRRVLRGALGIGPKTYARLKRFETAVRLAQRTPAPAWTCIAADAGYYDQAHLIADFHAIAGCTPGRLLAELREGEAS